MAVRDEARNKVREAIERVLRDQLGPLGFQAATVRAGVDHDGDPVLFVDANFKLVPEPLDPAFTVGITDAVRDALDAVGETRFPHINYELDDEQTFTKTMRKRA